MTADLKVVGEINPPAYKDPVKMLRSLADAIEAGEYGEIEAIAVVSATAYGIDTFSGGKQCGLHATAFLFGAAHTAMLQLPFDSL